MAQGAAGTKIKSDGATLGSPVTTHTIIADLPTNGEHPKNDTWEAPEKPGLKFRLKKFSRLILRDAVLKLPEPVVPVVYIEEKEREEPNPHDPDYLEAVNKYNVDVSFIAINSSIVLGTAVLTVPENMVGVDDDEWLAPLTIVGLPIPTDKHNRYLGWVKYYALDDDELIALSRASRRFNGYTFEENVEAAVEELKSDEKRDTDTSTPASSGSEQ